MFPSYIKYCIQVKLSMFLCNQLDISCTNTDCYPLKYGISMGFIPNQGPESGVCSESTFLGFFFCWCICLQPFLARTLQLQLVFSSYSMNIYIYNIIYVYIYMYICIYIYVYVYIYNSIEIIGKQDWQHRVNRTYVKLPWHWLKH